MTSYAQGTLIWVKHEEEVWIQAEIVTANDREIIVKTVEDANGRIVLGPNEPIFLRTSDMFTSEGLSVLDDLTQLTHLHEPAVLSSLQNRFDVDKIYTFTGPILIALNPFKYIPGLYDEAVLKSFITTEKIAKPHVFNTANSSYRGICDRQKSQTVLISGESGAGKTETTKHVMKFLALAGSADGQVTNVEKQVLESNPMLEAFGNARTLRNDNSSRFGKFIEMQFQSPGKSVVNTDIAPGTDKRLCGARVATYLLEKVRICEQQEGERNYHIFYEGCAAAVAMAASSYTFPQKLAKDKVKEEMTVDLTGFADLTNFAFLTRSSCKTLKDVDDVLMFEVRVAAMQAIGFSLEDINTVMNIVSAVLNLGNVKFDAPPNNSEGSQVMSECSKSIEMVAQLTGVSKDMLQGALCNTTRTVAGSKIRSPVKVTQAADNRDALAKALYGLIFNYVVTVANRSIGYRDDVKLFVGVLDIFGFECFKFNSFEQLCINFTNERLQQFFNSFVFKLEEQLYEREGIDWDALDFPDNQDSVDILQARTTGVFSMLDEECRVPNGSDQGFCSKLIKQHKGHRRFDEIKTKPTWFVIRHFAGPVQYCTDSFMDKNRDTLSGDIIQCMGSSTNPFIENLFKQDAKYADTFSSQEKTTTGKRKMYSVSSEFKDQLVSLMDIVDLTDPHFIRCIKPNPQNEQDSYDRKSVTEQLRYGGVLQVVQVSRAGYPVRINHQECWDDYKIIAQPATVASLKHIDDLKVRAQKLLDHLTKELNIPKPAHGLSTAVGKSLVFFKLPAFERLKFARHELLIKSSTLIQAHWRRMIQRKTYKAILVYTRHIQALMRGKQARDELRAFQQVHAACRLQAFARKIIEKSKFRAIVKKIIKIQAVRRGIRGRRYAAEYKRHFSATQIQRTWKRRQESRVFNALRTAIKVAQQRWRMHHAKTQRKALAQEQKEAGALMAKNQKAMEQLAETRKRNEELESHQLQLQAEKDKLELKVKQLEEAMKGKEEELETEKKNSEEAAKLAAQQAEEMIEQQKALVNSKELEEKDAELAKVNAELVSTKEILQKKEEELQQSEARYQSLLKNAAMQSTANFKGPAAAPGSGTTTINRNPVSNRNVFIQLIGAAGVGKTKLLESLIRELDPSQLSKVSEMETNLLAHHCFTVGDRTIKVLDCKSNVRAQHLVKEWFPRSQFVFLVYDLARPETFDYVLEHLPEVSAARAKPVLFGNKWSIENDNKQLKVDVTQAKDSAVRHAGFAQEDLTLAGAVRTAMNDSEAASADPGGPGRAAISGVLDSMKSWWGATGDKGQSRSANQGVLRPSLKGTKAMKQGRAEGNTDADLRAVQEVTDSESAVTNIVFGQEHQHQNYILLVTAAKDGTVVIYRCYRTEMEIAMLSPDIMQADSSSHAQPPADHSNIAVHSRLVGHSRAITSCFFNLLEDQLVTTSIDKSVRFWAVDSGEMLKVFTDSSPVPVAIFLQFSPQVFVAANSNAVLRLVNMQNGTVLQKLKVETEVRALQFDDTGLHLFAGTKSGSIHTLEASESNTLKFKHKLHLSRGGITCLTFVPAAHGMPACLLVNSSDSNASIVDCTYSGNNQIMNLQVRHRVRVAHSLLPLKCCYSPSGQGYLISGSEDKEVYIYSLAKGSNYKMHYLKHHPVPVVAVAVNKQDTLLASADSLGRIVLWRRMDYSHLPD
jgi:myosin heavy subunit/WD40 repeat protein